MLQLLTLACEKCVGKSCGQLNGTLTSQTQVPLPTLPPWQVPWKLQVFPDQLGQAKDRQTNRWIEIIMSYRLLDSSLLLFQWRSRSEGRWKRERRKETHMQKPVTDKRRIIYYTKESLLWVSSFNGYSSKSTQAFKERKIQSPLPAKMLKAFN